jgi:hypothetical protein
MEHKNKMFETTNQVYENGWMIQVFFEVTSLSLRWDVALLPSDHVTLLREQKWIGFFRSSSKYTCHVHPITYVQLPKGHPFLIPFLPMFGPWNSRCFLASPARHLQVTVLKTSVGKPFCGGWEAMGSHGKPGNGLIFLDPMGNQLPLGFGRPVMAKTGIMTVAYHMVLQGAGAELRA